MDIHWSIVTWMMLMSSLTNALPFFNRPDLSGNLVERLDDLTDILGYLKESVFGVPSNATGARVAEWNEDSSVNPEELGDYAEGDILFPKGTARNGLIARSTRWPRGVVPYLISPQFNPSVKQKILEAIGDYHANTCIKFVPYTGKERDYVRITAGNTGCWSAVGRTGGRQDLNLQVPGCVTYKGTIIHELMHALGFLHEQSRYDRDGYVDILWNNIQPKQKHNFNKAKKGTTEGFGFGYDYRSVMHYSARAFSVNGRPTIVPKQSSNGKKEVELGQRDRFSKQDIDKVNRMYCSARPSGRGI